MTELRNLLVCPCCGGAPEFNTVVKPDSIVLGTTNDIFYQQVGNIPTSAPWTMD